MSRPRPYVTWARVYMIFTLRSDIIYARNFPPDARTNVPRPAQFGIPDFEELFIPTPDGESLNAFYIRANRAQSRNVVRNLAYKILKLDADNARLFHRMLLRPMSNLSLHHSLLLASSEA